MNKRVVTVLEKRESGYRRVDKEAGGFPPPYYQVDFFDENGRLQGEVIIQGYTKAILFICWGSDGANG